MAFGRVIADWLIGGGAAAARIAETMQVELARNGGAAALAPDLNPRQRAAYDRLVDALNRLPRPLMALGTLALIAAALIEPVWFAARMEALAAMPEPMWWLIGAVVSLHFGGRMQIYAQSNRRPVALPPAPEVGAPAVPVPALPVPAVPVPAVPVPEVPVPALPAPAVPVPAVPVPAVPVPAVPVALPLTQA